MSFTNGKPFLVTDETASASWAGARDGRNFRCRLCGRFFVTGDYCIFIYANGTDSPTTCGNFLACSTADGPVHGSQAEMLTAAAEAERIVNERYWWALPIQQRPPRSGAKRDSRADRWD